MDHLPLSFVLVHLVQDVNEGRRGEERRVIYVGGVLFSDAT